MIRKEKEEQHTKHWRRELERLGKMFQADRRQDIGKGESKKRKVPKRRKRRGHGEGCISVGGLLEDYRGLSEVRPLTP